MNELEKFRSQAIEQKAGNFETTDGWANNAESNVVSGVLRRGYIVYNRFTRYMAFD